MFSVKLVARPDARMVEVPLEIEAELPREFEGVALLAASGLPRKVRIKAMRDALKLSTAYRTDQLVGDIVRSTLRGTAQDVERVQDAVTRFVRTLRERRQDGATLLVSSNGRGKIQVAEQLPGRAGQPSAPPPAASAPPPPDRGPALEWRILQLETALARAAPGGELGDRVAALEQHVAALAEQISRALTVSAIAGPGMEKSPAPGPRSGTRRATALDAYAEGLRGELRARAEAASAQSRADVERCDRASALAAEAELLGAPHDGTSQRLQEASALAAARRSSLERLAGELEFYAAADLPLAAQLLARLAESPAAPDPASSLEPVAQAVVRNARGSDCKPRTAWLRRAAALCAWELLEPRRGERVSADLCKAVDAGGETVVRLASPGLKRSDGTTLVRARVQVDPAAANAPEEPDEPPAVEEPLAIPAQALEGGEAAGPAPDGSAGLLPSTEVLAGPAAAAASGGAEAARPFGDVGGEQIQAEEAAAAADAARRIPTIVPDDPVDSDEALAAEVALTLAAAEQPEDVQHELHDEDIEELPAASALPEDGAKK
ncbi:MAG TPA: hypothetical protein VFL36_05775 [Myxococcales bacterium]|nr:hypothetical protein [Myxococcales bacterium]